MLSAEPVFATIIAVILLRETSSLMEFIGGALLFMAAVIAAVRSSRAALGPLLGLDPQNAAQILIYSMPNG